MQSSQRSSAFGSGAQLDEDSEHVGLPLSAILQCDAFTVDVDVWRGAKLHFRRYEDRNVFLMQLGPVNPAVPVLIAHMHGAASGNATDFTIEAMKQVTINSYRHANVRTLAIAVDGDRRYDGEFGKVWETFRALLPEGLKDPGAWMTEYGIAAFCELWEARIGGGDFQHGMEGSCQMTWTPNWLTDWLHVLKNALSRLKHSKVAFNCQRDDSTFDHLMINEVLNMPAIFLQDSSLFSMCDAPPLMAMKVSNAIVLLNAGLQDPEKRDSLISAGLYLLTYGVVVLALDGEFDQRVREWLLLLFASICQHQLNAVTSRRKARGVQQSKKVKDQYFKAVSFAERMKLIRMILTALGTIAVMRLEPIALLRRLGTSELEGTIGTIRAMCFDDDNFNQVDRVVSRKALCDGLVSTVGCCVERKGRRHVAGATAVQAEAGPCDESPELHLPPFPAAESAEALLSLIGMVDCPS
jgi:hypothetical protein